MELAWFLQGMTYDYLHVLVVFSYPLQI
jgi:hypothetical protein